MEDKFTAREVVAIVEDLRGEFRVVAESVNGLSVRVGSLENRVGTLETRVGSLEDAVRVAIPTINRRLTALESKG